MVQGACCKFAPSARLQEQLPILQLSEVFQQNGELNEILLQIPDPLLVYFSRTLLCVLELRESNTFPKNVCNDTGLFLTVTSCLTCPVPISVESQ